MRLMIEILAALLLVICIGASSAAAFSMLQDASPCGVIL